MLKVGLTGNIGSGKSVIARIFSILNVPVYHADDVSKNFLSDRAVKEKILDIFGPQVFLASADIDRKALGTVVFNDPAKLATLNAILHPLVRDDFRAWCKAKEWQPYIIEEAAIIFESGFRDEFDRIIHVSCPEDLAVKRVMERDRAGREEVLKRMRSQWNNEKKAAISDYIILNDGSELVIPQVLAIHDLLMDSSRKG